MIRLAISGAGAITERAHIPAFLSVPEIQIVALQSRTNNCTCSGVIVERLGVNVSSRSKKMCLGII